MKWVISNNVYLYDGSYDGFLSTVYSLILLKEIPSAIVEESLYEDNLIDIPIFIETDFEKSKKIITFISNISEVSMYNIYQALLSGDKDKGIIIYKYILNVIKYKKNIDCMQNKDCIISLRGICRKVGCESHRLKGFLRFKELDKNILYAEMEPDNNVIEYLARHFKLRLKNENFIIHDKRRKIVALYDTKKVYYGSADDLLINDLKDDNYELMWKDYFNNIAIKERTNKRCQLGFMPRRYWKYMLEVKEEV